MNPEFTKLTFNDLSFIQLGSNSLQAELRIEVSQLPTATQSVEIARSQSSILHHPLAVNEEDVTTAPATCVRKYIKQKKLKGEEVGELKSGFILSGNVTSPKRSFKSIKMKMVIHSRALAIPSTKAFLSIWLPRITLLKKKAIK
jgi:hypothetical protein